MILYKILKMIALLACGKCKNNKTFIRRKQQNRHCCIDLFFNRIQVENYSFYIYNISYFCIHRSLKAICRMNINCISVKQLKMCMKWGCEINNAQYESKMFCLVSP